jgi:hypothetical protein
MFSFTERNVRAATLHSFFIGQPTRAAVSRAV